MQDKPSDTGFLISEILPDLAILADTAVRRFINKKVAVTKILSENKTYERLLDVDVTVRIEDANDSGFNMDLQVALTLPPFVNLNERELAEEAANYALEEVEKKFAELERSNPTGSELVPKNPGITPKNEEQ